MNTFNDLFEPEDSIDRLAEVLKYGRPGIYELVEILELGDTTKHDNVEKHLTVIYLAACEYSFYFLSGRHDLHNHPTKDRVLPTPSLSLLSFLHMYSWSIEDFNEGLLEIET